MSSNNAKMPASTNAMKNNTKPPAGNVIESKSTKTPVVTTAIKRELSATSLTSNGMPKLSSLTPARDLTLGGRGGGTASAKKVFLPNLNVVRNKNTNVKTSKDTTSSRGRGRGRGADRGGRGASRGGRGGSSSLIQTTGVFSEGAGATNIRPSARSSGYSRDVEDSVSAMRKPTLLKSEKKLDIKAVLAKDVDILKSLDDIDDDEEIEQKTDLDKIPVQLKEALAVASQIQALYVAEQAQQQLNSIPRYPQTIKELLDNNQSQIFLMQLPDTLPCVDDDDSYSPELSTQPSTSSASEIRTAAKNTVERKKPESNVLKNMEEGQVGRLIRYKSGKTKLVLGQTYFDLGIGIETGFLQELMSIHCNREERSGNMINLGPVQAKVTATPDWEHLLNQHSNNQHV